MGECTRLHGFNLSGNEVEIVGANYNLIESGLGARKTDDLIILEAYQGFLANKDT